MLVKGKDFAIIRSCLVVGNKTEERDTAEKLAHKYADTVGGSFSYDGRVITTATGKVYYGGGFGEAIATLLFDETGIEIEGNDIRLLDRFVKKYEK